MTKSNNNPVANDPEVQFVKANWETIPLPMRAEKVAKFVDRYGSQRLVAGALGKDEGTVRRDVEVSKLSEVDKQRILQGESVTAILARPSKAAIAEAATARTQAMQRDTDIRMWLEGVHKGVEESMENYRRVERMGADGMRPQNRDAK